MELSAIVEKVCPKTLSKFTFALIACWMVSGSILLGAFSDMEINEPRFDFGCDGKGNIDKDFLRGKCYDQYWIQNHKLGIPPYLFVIVNVLLIPIVTFIYSQYAKSTVNELERNPQDAEGQPRNPRRNLFNAYLCQLIVSIVLAITFILFLESHLFYPKNFPSNFSCSIENSSSVNGTQSTTLFNCSNRRAGSKNVWTKVVTAANGMFAIFAFLEIIWILSRGRHEKEFMENWQFYANHLKSNSDKQRQGQPDRISLVESQDRAVNIPHEPRNDEITNSSELQEHAQARNDFHSGQTDWIPLVESQDRAVNIPHKPRNDEITNSSELQEHAQALNDFHSGQTDGIPLVESQDRAVNITHEPRNNEITNSSELQEHAQARNDFHSGQSDGIPLVKSQDRAVNITHEPRNNEITNSSELQEHAQARNDFHSGQTDGIPLVESQDRAVNITHEPRNDEITNSSELQEHAQARNDFHSGQTDGIPLVESQDRAVNIPHKPRNDEITNSSELQEHAQARNDFQSGQTDGIPLVESEDRAVNITHEPRNDEITNSSELQEHAQARNDFHPTIQTLKWNSLQDTEKPSDLKHPFGQPNPGEGHIYDLTIDEIYVHVAIVENRVYHKFAEDRWEQLKEYPPDAKDCKFAKPEDILGENHKNVLVVGRPGIGKTSLSTKLLRLWASGEAFNGDQHFNVVFLLKFRRFNNNNANLSLRDLLAAAETVQSLDDAMWDFIKQEPTKVLLIFDGLDEYSRKEDIKAQEDDPTYKNCVEKKMPFSVLYNKLVEGKLLPGVSIVTTTRPTAVKCVRHVPFQRTVEIRGFTSDDVKEYVKNFTRGNPEAMKKMWEHIKSNINLFSFCYIPMNCFLICHCLLQIILSESSQALPTKMTDIYKMTVKMFLFNHNREGFSPQELARLKSTHMDQPFDKLPDEFQKILNSLGKIAFKGIEEGRLLFESSEVSELEDCGLLHKLPDLKRKALDDPPKSQFCFTHLTVQEFFAAKHLVDTKTNEGIEGFIRNHINDGKWQVVLQFAAGLLKNSLSSHIFIELLPESTEKRKSLESSKPKTLTYWPATKQDKDLAVQVCKCLYEINDEQQPVLQNKIEKIKFNAVEFSRYSLAPIDVAAILHFLENAEKVSYIDLSANHLGDLSANEVEKFLVHGEHKLKLLQLNGNEFTDNAAKDFAGALKHSNCQLESLDLRSNNFTDNAAKEFAAALKHSNCKLESLYLRSNNFTDNAAKQFAAALKHSNCKLESLDLRSNNFTDNAAKEFAAALKHSNCKLESLEISVNKFTDNAAKEFAAALKHSNCKLESLDLSLNYFTDNAAKDFAAALKHSNCKLESLDLSGNEFTDNAAKKFAAALKHSNCKLESLYLSGNEFTDNAAKKFAAALKHSNCKLESLDLSLNYFTDNAAKDFAAALKHSNCKLESLDLNDNNFTDNAAKDFAAALKHSNCKLESLDLSPNYFTDNAAKEFALALKHSNCKLESLDLGFNKFTEEGNKYLTDAGKQSNCEVVL